MQVVGCIKNRHMENKDTEKSIQANINGVAEAQQLGASITRKDDPGVFPIDHGRAAKDRRHRQPEPA